MYIRVCTASSRINACVTVGVRHPQKRGRRFASAVAAASAASDDWERAIAGALTRARARGGMRRRTPPPTPPRRRTQPVLFLAVCPHSADAAAPTAHSQHQHTQATSTSTSTSASTRYCASPRSNIIRVIGTPRAQSVVGHALLTTTNDRDLPVVHLQVSVAKIIDIVLWSVL